MTRETRIALLVGLAFIVLFGLVLGQRSMNLQSQSPTLATNVGPAGAAHNTSTEESRPSNELVGSTIPDSSHGVSTAAPSHADAAAPPSRVNPPADAHVAVAPGISHAAAPTPAAAPSPTKPADAAEASANPAEGHRAVVTETAKTADSAEKNVIDISATDDSSGKTYKVQAGDNIFRIAKKLNMGNGGPSKIMAMNKDRIKNFTAIQVGQEILVPADDTAKVTPARADASKNDVPANLANATAVKRPSAADPLVAAPADKSVLAAVEKKPADDKPVLAATGGKGDVEGTLAKPRDDVKSAAPADKTAKSASLDKLDDKLNGKADAAVAGKTYKVRAGDSLYSIAGDQMGSRTKAAVQKLMQANGIKDPAKLAAGSELKIPKA